MLPNETLLDMLRHLNGRDFDVLERVNRVLGSLIAANFDDVPRRVVSLMFFEHGYVMLTCPTHGFRRVRVVELPRYLPRSVIKKMVFGSSHTVTEDTYQALLPCRAHLTADAVCDFQSLSVSHPDVLRRALTEVFMCSTLVFTDRTFSAMHDLRLYRDMQDPATLPCIASCANLQIKHYGAFFDANGALAWLLGMQGAAAAEKHLSIGEIVGFDLRSRNFLRSFIAAVQQQFIQATTPASFTVELLYIVGHDQHDERINVATRELENVATNEQLKVGMDTQVRNLNGRLAFKTKVTIQRKMAA